MALNQLRYFALLSIYPGVFCRDFFCQKFLCFNSCPTGN